MLLAIDVGNTQTHLGVFSQNALTHEWRASTDGRRTADEWALMFGEFLSLADLSFSRQITGVAISSVVPPATQELRQMAMNYFGYPPVVVEPGVKTGLAIATDNPREVGADRIANAVAAHALFPDEPVVVVDFGTALNFDVVSQRGEYLGGVIGPGIEASATALFSATARIPRVELVAPASVIGKNTVACVQSALIYGTASLVDGLLERIRDELGAGTRAIATGGAAARVVEHCKHIEWIEPILTLNGLRLIFELNASS